MHEFCIQIKCDFISLLDGRQIENIVFGSPRLTTFRMRRIRISKLKIKKNLWKLEEQFLKTLMRMNVKSEIKSFINIINNWKNL